MHPLFYNKIDAGSNDNVRSSTYRRRFRTRSRAVQWPDDQSVNPHSWWLPTLTPNLVSRNILIPLLLSDCVFVLVPFFDLLFKSLRKIPGVYLSPFIIICRSTRHGCQYMFFHGMVDCFPSLRHVPWFWACPGMIVRVLCVPYMPIYLGIYPR